jgi:DNA primase
MSRSGLRYKDFYTRIDYDSLYGDLDWEPNESNGPEDKGYCLDAWGLHKHGDTTGKLAINRDKGVYNCWVCGGGTILSLVMEVKNLDWQEATEYLFGFTKSEKVSNSEFYEKVQRLLASEDKQEKPLPHFNRRVVEQWADEDHEWFRSRGISREVCKYFSLGFNGKCRTFKKDMGTYEGPGIILPHFGGNNLLGWQTRWLDDLRPRWVAKYTNTVDFPRETTLWGYDFAQRQPEPPILVESVATALFLLSEGHNACASFGSQLTPSQLRLLRSFQSGVILARDNDEPGRKWLNDATNYLERYIKVLHVPPVNGEGADLGDLSPAELSLHLQGITHPYGF